jgi:hypothetical protein
VALLGDEVGYRPKRSKLLVRCTGPLGLGWLTHEPACAQIGERVSFIHGRKPGDSPATHRHDHLATLSGVVHVSTQLIVQLSDTNLGLRRWPM